MRPSSLWAWLTALAGGAYFLLPLVATVQFSLLGRAGLSLAAYQSVFTDPRFWSSLGFSLTMAVLAATIGAVVVVPAAFWAHLRLPRVKTWLEFASLLPFIVPAIVLALGLVRLYGSSPLFGMSTLLAAAYAVLSLPYLYRAVANGLDATDMRRLAEAAVGLGAGWRTVLTWVVLPNLRGALLGGSFLVFALVMGEFAIADMFGFNTFGVYMDLVGETRVHAAAALAVVSFGIVWICIGLLHLFGKGVSMLGEGSR